MERSREDVQEAPAVNVATELRDLDRSVTLDCFDLGTEKESTVRTPPRGAERRASGERNVHPADLGCVDWYLYPVDRTPKFPQLKPEADLTLR
jgi:hypothetical protein